MIIKQVSVNIENRTGSCWQVFQSMADNGINILSYSIEDAPDHGTLRLIVDNATRADELLRGQGFISQLISVYFDERTQRDRIDEQSAAPSGRKQRIN